MESIPQEIITIISEFLPPIWRASFRATCFHIRARVPVVNMDLSTAIIGERMYRIKVAVREGLIPPLYGSQKALVRLLQDSGRMLESWRDTPGFDVDQGANAHRLGERELVLLIRYIFTEYKGCGSDEIILDLPITRGHKILPIIIAEHARANSYSIDLRYWKKFAGEPSSSHMYIYSVAAAILLLPNELSILGAMGYEGTGTDAVYLAKYYCMKAPGRDTKPLQPHLGEHYGLFLEYLSDPDSAWIPHAKLEDYARRRYKYGFAAEIDQDIRLIVRYKRFDLLRALRNNQKKHDLYEKVILQLLYEGLLKPSDPY